MLSNIKNTSMPKKEELIKKGKDLIKNNSFYYTLHVLLRYYFLKSQDFFMMSFLKDVTNSESEFKVFMVYVEFSIYVYNTYIKNIEDFKDDNEDIVFILISYVKHLYSQDTNVLKPFITSISENQDEIIDKFNKVKSLYNFKKDSLDKFETVNNIIYNLQKAKEYEEESKRYSNLAFSMLQDLKEQYKDTIYSKDLIKDI